MGREVRRVPKDWQHPQKERDFSHPAVKPAYIPLLAGSFEQDAREWQDGLALWLTGFRRDFKDEADTVPIPPDHRLDVWGWIQWSGGQPQLEDYMPDWPEAERTHLMMYEDTSEGTPISPAFETPEELARWLTDNGASAFGGQTASYEGWLAVCRGAWAPSAVMRGGQMVSGVDFAAEQQP
jgi:hypothetical protein